MTILKLVKYFYHYSLLKDKEKQIVVFLEKKHDFIYFKEFLNDLYKDLNVKALIFCSEFDENEELKKNNFISSLIYIGTGLTRFLYFKLIKTKIFFMTTPDLENSELKRSIHSVKYFYIFHSIASLHTIYNHLAFSYYDYILTVGPHHDAEIKAIEKKYFTYKKKIIPFGYPRLIEMKNNYKFKEGKKNKTILIAPTWGEWSITNLCLEELFNKLVNLNFNIVYRPHPKSVLDEKQFLKKMDNAYSKKIKFQYEISSTNFLNYVDILITDWSGFAFEYYLTTSKSIIFIDTPPKIRNKDFKKLKLKPLEDTIRKKIGYVLDLKSIKNINNLILKILSKNNYHCKKISIIHDYKSNYKNLLREIKINL